MQNTQVDYPPDDITDFIKKGNIFVVSGTYCPYCTVAKKTLDDLGCKYTYLECDETPLNQQNRDKLVQLSGIKTIPNIFIGTKSIGGCSDLLNYRKNGQLAQILKDNDVKCTKI
jgi:glutaredoxin 3